ncbi:MAG: hypothetical protein FOGNACKC_03280 [Anaerolineae bacterium]|nr:hypothetical protein [Anaerolineae bacterium]
MLAGYVAVNLEKEAENLVQSMHKGDLCGSVHLARLIEADTRGVFQPFADALAARIQDHLGRWAELGETDPHITLEDEVYHLLKAASIDWDGAPCSGRPGEEA